MVITYRCLHFKRQCTLLAFIIGFSLCVFLLLLARLRGFVESNYYSSMSATEAVAKNIL
jgi:hypothetical protein